MATMHSRIKSATLKCDVLAFSDVKLATDCTTVVIGRSRNADYRIEHPQVSGLQCTITLRQGILTLRDTSTNGTYVDGEEVGRDNTVELHQGSLVTLLVPSVDERDEEFGASIPAFSVHMSEDDKPVHPFNVRIFNAALAAPRPASPPLAPAPAACGAPRPALQAAAGGSAKRAAAALDPAASASAAAKGVDAKRSKPDQPKAISLIASASGAARQGGVTAAAPITAPIALETNNLRRRSARRTAGDVNAEDAACGVRVPVAVGGVGPALRARARAHMAERDRQPPTAALATASPIETYVGRQLRGHASKRHAGTLQRPSGPSLSLEQVSLVNCH